MPTYDYQCLSCEEVFEGFVMISKRLDNQKCPKCGHLESKLLPSFTTNFILKGSGWPSKAMLINKEMTKKNDDNKIKQQQYKSSTPTLVPNVEGQQVDSWRDAQKLAKEKGYDTKTYDKPIDANPKK